MTDLSERNLVLYAAGYSDPESATQDYESLKDLRDVEVYLMAAVIMDRDADGKITVREKAHLVSGGALVGGGVGMLLGIFSPPLLAATALGAGVGAAVGGVKKKRDEKKIAEDLEDVLPNNSSAIIAILDDAYADKLDAALAKANKRSVTKVDPEEATSLAKALEGGSDAELIQQVNS
jgi:uncharacterized membrane protein